VNELRDAVYAVYVQYQESADAIVCDPELASSFAARVNATPGQERKPGKITGHIGYQWRDCGGPTAAPLEMTDEKSCLSRGASDRIARVKARSVFV
jgi:hypothetical protein